MSLDYVLLSGQKQVYPAQILNETDVDWKGAKGATKKIYAVISKPNG